MGPDSNNEDILEEPANSTQSTRHLPDKMLCTSHCCKIFTRRISNTTWNWNITYNRSSTREKHSRSPGLPTCSGTSAGAEAAHSADTLPPGALGWTATAYEAAQPGPSCTFLRSPFTFTADMVVWWSGGGSDESTRTVLGKLWHPYLFENSTIAGDIHPLVTTSRDLGGGRFHGCGRVLDFFYRCGMDGCSGKRSH